MSGPAVFPEAPIGVSATELWAWVSPHGISLVKARALSIATPL